MSYLTSCNRYFNSASGLTDPLANPMSRDLTGMPRTHVITAEFDPLKSEGEMFVHKMRSSGAVVTHAHYNNTVHGFFGSYLFTHGVEALQEVIELIKMNVDGDIKK